MDRPAALLLVGTKRAYGKDAAMPLKKMFLALSTVVAVAILLDPRDALAVSAYTNPGPQCSGLNNSTTFATSFALQNPSSATAQTYTCPVVNGTFTNTNQLSNFFVYYFDGAPAAGQQVKARMLATDTAGGFVFGAYKYSCSTTIGGCSSPSASDTYSGHDLLILATGSLANPLVVYAEVVLPAIGTGSTSGIDAYQVTF
jgi:hypothetical protein